MEKLVVRDPRCLKLLQEIEPFATVAFEVILLMCTNQDRVVSTWILSNNSGNTLCLINVVTPRQARLVPGQVTVCGRVNHLGTEPGTQADSA